MIFEGVIIDDFYVWVFIRDNEFGEKLRSRIENVIIVWDEGVYIGRFWLKGSILFRVVVYII